MWRQKLCVKLNGGKIKITHPRCKNSGNMSIFNHTHSMFRFCFIYLLPRRKRNDSFHFQPFFRQNLSFPAFSIYSQSLEYELITSDHRSNQIAWNRITDGLYLIIGVIFCVLLMQEFFSKPFFSAFHFPLSTPLSLFKWCVPQEKFLKNCERPQAHRLYPYWLSYKKGEKIKSL